MTATSRHLETGHRHVREHLVKSAIQGALVLVLVVPLGARAASEGDVRTSITSISRLYESLEYEHALRQIQFARQLPRGTEEEVTLSLYEGIILCEMSKQAQGSASFKSALLLRPDVKLPVRVAPKVEALFQAVRQQVKSELASLLARREAESPKAPQPEAPALPAPAPALPPPTKVSSSAPRRDTLRRHSLIPAIAGGTLVAAGGLAWTLSRGELNQLRNDDPRLATMDDARRSMSRGRTWQTVGVSLLSAGAVGLATAAGMYLLGAPEQPLALGVSTDGTSAFVQGKWP